MHSERVSSITRGGARLQAVLAAALLVGSGVADARSAGSQAAPPATARRMVDREWVGIWKVGDAATDELFAFPRELVATKEGVYVLDIGTLEVIAFDPLGRKRWTAGSRGKGPGQLLQPVDLTLAPNGDVAVLDPGNGRVSFFTAAGTFRRSVVVPGAVQASSLCITSDARIHLWVARPASDIVSAEASGKVVSQRSFPWRVPARSPELLRSAYFARGVPTNECAFATLFGFGVGRLTAAGITTTSYVETVAPPTLVRERLRDGIVRTTLSQGVNAAAAAMHSGDTVMVHFAGASPLAHRVADLYLPSRGYLESWSLPGCGRVAYHDPWLYCMANMSESPRLVAYVAKRDTARVLRLFPRAGARSASRGAGSRGTGSRGAGSPGTGSRGVGASSPARVGQRGMLPVSR